jgi:hypothetical protein
MSRKVFSQRYIESAILKSRTPKQQRERESHERLTARNKKHIADTAKARGSCCEICKMVDDPSIYEWHHINYDEKLSDISTLVGAHASIARLTRELDKCLLLCPNCHEKVHLDLVCMLEHKNRPDIIPYSHVDGESYIGIDTSKEEPTALELLIGETK